MHIIRDPKAAAFPAASRWVGESDPINDLANPFVQVARSIALF